MNCLNIREKTRSISKRRQCRADTISVKILHFRETKLQWNMYKHCPHPVLAEGTKERFICKMLMKEIDKHALGKKICKLNHKEAAIKPVGAVQLWVLLSASLTLQPHQLPGVVHCVSPDYWTDGTGIRLGTGMRGGSRNWCHFSPKKAAEGNNLLETWKQPAAKDSDCRSCNLSTFYVLFPSACHLFKSAQDTSRSPLELRTPWLGQHSWPACNRINQDIRYGLVYIVNLSWSTEVGGYSSVCICVYLEEKILKTHFAHTWHLATVSSKIRE